MQQIRQFFSLWFDPIGTRTHNRGEHLNHRYGFSLCKYKCISIQTFVEQLYKRSSSIQTNFEINIHVYLYLREASRNAIAKKKSSAVDSWVRA